jgi:hypothetical protein
MIAFFDIALVGGLRCFFSGFVLYLCVSDDGSDCCFQESAVAQHLSFSSFVFSAIKKSGGCEAEEAVCAVRDDGTESEGHSGTACFAQRRVGSFLLGLYPLFLVDSVSLPFSLPFFG